MWGLDLSGSEQGAGGVGGLVLFNDSAQGVSFPVYDGNGNVVKLVKGTDSTTVADYEYDPFGQMIRMSGAGAGVNPMRFSTKYQDGETDLLYYGYRYYSPSLGRWMNRDPLGEEGGVGLYATAQNSTLGSIDPLGLAAFETTTSVYIFLTLEDTEFKEAKTMAYLKTIGNNIDWFLLRAPLPAGTTPGWQTGRFFSGGCNIYFVDFQVKNTPIREGLEFMGHGQNGVATLYPTRFMNDFDNRKGTGGLPRNWEDKSGISAWHRMSPYMAVHEILHAVGVPHADNFWNRNSTLIMTGQVTYSWLNNMPELDNASAARARHNLRALEAQDFAI